MNLDHHGIRPTTRGGSERPHLPMGMPPGMATGTQPGAEPSMPLHAPVRGAAYVPAGRPAAMARPVRSSLVVTMLDGFSMLVPEGGPLPLPSGRARTLLMLLLLRHGRALSRSRLVAAMWPEAEPDSARNCLNVMLHRVRRALGGVATVVHTPEGYRFESGCELWLDAEQFLWHAENGRREEAAGHVATARQHYEAARGLYRADLQEEDDGDPVLAADEQALRDRHREVLDRLAAMLETEGAWHACMSLAREQLAADPCNEYAHRRLMRCHAQLGQLERAERQFRECVRVLRQRFGLAPSEETTLLYRRIASRLAA